MNIDVNTDASHRSTDIKDFNLSLKKFSFNFDKNGGSYVS